MHLLFLYFKSHLKSLLLFVSFCISSAVIYSLYDLPLEAVAYAIIMCAFFGLILLAFDYISFYKKHKTLVRLINEITVTADNFPNPSTWIEEDYRNVLISLYEDKTKIVGEQNNRYSELVEYYTVWAHQIKTPIAAMRLILQNEDTPLNRELTAELVRIEQYVEMVMGYLRLESDTTDYVIRRCELDAIIKHSVRKYASQFIRKKIKLSYVPVSLSVLTDEKWLSFVIEQILSNSLKYTRSGSITISMREPFVLTISDTGIGIAAEDIPRVFEKGFTGYNGHSDKKASGIGLYLCKRILNKLGHAISLESEKGVGTTVLINLESYNITE